MLDGAGVSAVYVDGGKLIVPVVAGGGGIVRGRVRHSPPDIGRNVARARTRTRYTRGPSLTTTSYRNTSHIHRDSPRDIHKQSQTHHMYWRNNNWRNKICDHARVREI